jgi:hypothetical protein
MINSLYQNDLTLFFVIEITYTKAVYMSSKLLRSTKYKHSKEYALHALWPRILVSKCQRSPWLCHKHISRLPLEFEIQEEIIFINEF